MVTKNSTLPCLCLSCACERVMCVAALLHEHRKWGYSSDTFYHQNLTQFFTCGTFPWVAVQRACLDPCEQCRVLRDARQMGTLLFGQYSSTWKMVYSLFWGNRKSKYICLQFCAQSAIGSLCLSKEICFVWNFYFYYDQILCGINNI